MEINVKSSMNDSIDWQVAALDDLKECNSALASLGELIESHNSVQRDLNRQSANTVAARRLLQTILNDLSTKNNSVEEFKGRLTQVLALLR